MRSCNPPHVHFIIYAQYFWQICLQTACNAKNAVWELASSQRLIDLLHGFPKVKVHISAIIQLSFGSQYTKERERRPKKMTIRQKNTVCSSSFICICAHAVVSEVPCYSHQSLIFIPSFDSHWDDLCVHDIVLFDYYIWVCMLLSLFSVVFRMPLGDELWTLEVRDFPGTLPLLPAVYTFLFTPEGRLKSEFYSKQRFACC